MEDKYSQTRKYNYSDFRKVISEILERNGKRIKITEVLRNCGIPKGNYYLFMKGGREYKGSYTPTLSYEKLDRLLEELRKADVYSTNRQRLASMSDRNLARFIEEEIINDPNSKKLDIYKWLKSDDPKLIYKGDKNG